MSGESNPAFSAQIHHSNLSAEQIESIENDIVRKLLASVSTPGSRQDDPQSFPNEFANQFINDFLNVD